MRDYEVVFIIKASESDESIDALVEQMQAVAREHGAEIRNVDKWGRRKLAYDIGKEREGFYVLFHLRTGPAAVAELERRFHLSESIIRWLSVRIDDELRRARRRATIRARKKGLEAPVDLPITRSRPREDEEEPVAETVRGRQAAIEDEEGES